MIPLSLRRHGLEYRLSEEAKKLAYNTRLTPVKAWQLLCLQEEIPADTVPTRARMKFLCSFHYWRNRPEYRLGIKAWKQLLNTRTVGKEAKPRAVLEAVAALINGAYAARLVWNIQPGDMIDEIGAAIERGWHTIVCRGGTTTYVEHIAARITRIARRHNIRKDILEWIVQAYEGRG